MSLSQAITEAVLPDTSKISGQEARSIKFEISAQDARSIAIGYLNYAIKALKTLCSGKLQKFDALAGDTACQKRALIICKLFEDSKKDEFKNVLSLCSQIQNLDIIAMEDSLLRSKNEKQAFVKKIISEDLELDINMRVAISAYILTKTRGTQDKSTTDATKLKYFPDSLKEGICFQLKHSLSKDSVTLIQAIAKDLFSKNLINKTELGLVQGNHVREYARIYRTPLSYNMHVIIQEIKRIQLPILLMTQEGHCLINKGNENGAVFLIQGEVTSGSNLDIICSQIEEEILTACAHHPQYPKENGEEPGIDFFKGTERENFLEKILAESRSKNLSIQDATQNILSRTPKKDKFLWGNGQIPDQVAASFAALKQRQEKQMRLNIKHIYPSTLQEALGGK